MGSPSPRLQALYDRRSQEQEILRAAKHGPLQSLSDRELALQRQPVTIYPPGTQQRVQAWVRFGPEPVRVRATLVRSTPTAAGIEFHADGTTFKCWVWGNAVAVDEGT